jgi:hypothetical protein
MAEETTIDETDREVLQAYASHVALRNKGCFRMHHGTVCFK